MCIYIFLFLDRKLHSSFKRKHKLLKQRMMERHKDPRKAPSPEYDPLAADYIRALFSVIHPIQPQYYPRGSTYPPAFNKSHLHQSEERQNALRCFMDFNQIYAQNFTPIMLQMFTHLPRQRRVANSHRKQSNARSSQILELNRRRPSVIRRSIKSHGKFSSPREAVLEHDFQKDHQVITPVIPNYPQPNGRIIRAGPLLLAKAAPIHIQKYRNAEPSVNHRDINLSIKDSRLPFDTRKEVPAMPKDPQLPRNILPNCEEFPVIEGNQKHKSLSMNTPPKPMDSITSQALLTKPSTLEPRHVEHERPDTLSKDGTTNRLDSNVSKTLPKDYKTVSPGQTDLAPNEKDQACTKIDKKGKYCCSYCKKHFRWFSHWQAHERTHTGYRPYKCPECDRCFTRGDGLRAHMVIHNTKKPFKCPKCAKCFARKSTLDRHVFEHTGVIPYTCAVCKKTLADTESIEGHLGAHKDQKKFECQYCGKQFISGLRLVRHIRGHTGKDAVTRYIFWCN